MDTVYVVRRARFSAAHRLCNPAWSDDENLAVFGACSNPAGHGHNYVIEVWLAGVADERTGYLFDLRQLKRIIDEEIIQHVDHKHLNHDVEFLRGVNPTAEQLAVAFWRRLEPRISRELLHAVRVYESERNFAEFRGEGRGRPSHSPESGTPPPRSEIDQA